MIRSNRAVFFASFLFLSFAAGAPARSAEGLDWVGVKQLAPGQKAKLSLTDGKSYQGEVLSVNDEALTIHLAPADRTFARETIRRVSVKRNGHRGRHALIGAAIDSNCSGFCDNKGKPLGAQRCLASLARRLARYSPPEAGKKSIIPTDPHTSLACV